MTIAGFGITALFVVLLGVLIGIKGAVGALPAVAVVTVPLARHPVGHRPVHPHPHQGGLAGRARGGRAPQRGARLPDRDHEPAPHRCRTASSSRSSSSRCRSWSPSAPCGSSSSRSAWFDGTVEKPLRAEESGARPIATPLIAVESRSAEVAGVEVAEIRPRFLAYVVDVVVAAVLSAIPVALASHPPAGHDRARRRRAARVHRGHALLPVLLARDRADAGHARDQGPGRPRDPRRARSRGARPSSAMSCSCSAPWPSTSAGCGCSSTRARRLARHRGGHDRHRRIDRPDRDHGGGDRGRDGRTGSHRPGRPHR